MNKKIDIKDFYFSNSLIMFRSWSAQKHASLDIPRIERLTQLLTKNKWSIQPSCFTPQQVTPTKKNPWGILGLDNHEQLELLYYDGLVAGMALTSGSPEAFYKAVFEDAIEYAAKKWHDKDIIEKADTTNPQ